MSNFSNTLHALDNLIALEKPLSSKQRSARTKKAWIKRQRGKKVKRNLVGYTRKISKQKDLQKKYLRSKQGFANITEEDMAKADKEDKKGSGAGKLGIHFPAKYLQYAQKFDEMPTEWKGKVLRELGYDDDDIEELNDKQKFMYDEWAGAMSGHGKGIKEFNEVVDLQNDIWMRSQTGGYDEFHYDDEDWVWREKQAGNIDAAGFHVDDPEGD